MADGRVKHVNAIAHALQDASGNREFVGAVTDVSEQRHAEADDQKEQESGASRRGRYHSSDSLERTTGRSEFLRQQAIRRVLWDAARADRRIRLACRNSPR